MKNMNVHINGKQVITALLIAIVVFGFAALNELQAAGDLTAQEPIEVKLQLGSEKDEMVFVPNELEFETEWDEATLWKTYTLLTDLEGVFRSLKSELGMRPIYHQTEERVSGFEIIRLCFYGVFCFKMSKMG